MQNMMQVTVSLCKCICMGSGWTAAYANAYVWAVAGQQRSGGTHWHHDWQVRTGYLYFKLPVQLEILVI